MSYITIYELNDVGSSMDCFEYEYCVDLGEAGEHNMSVEIDPSDYIGEPAIECADVELNHIARQVEQEGELDSLIAELAIVFGVEKLLEALADEAEKLRINTLLEPAA